MLLYVISTMTCFVLVLQTLASGYKHNRKEFARQSLQSTLSDTHNSSAHSAHEAQHEVADAEMFSDSLFNPNMVSTQLTLTFGWVLFWSAEYDTAMFFQPLEPVLPEGMQEWGKMAALSR